MLLAASGCAASGEDPVQGTAGALSALPDLAITAVSAPPSGLPHDYFDVSVTVCNQGESYSDATSVDVVLSNDSTIDMLDTPLGSAPLWPLAAGQCQTVTVHAYTSEAEGVYTVGAIVDATDAIPELDDTNNAMASKPMGIGWGPDLVVASVSGPPTALPWNDLETTVVVCNQGTLASHDTPVGVHLSTDDEITLDDALISTQFVSWLDPGQCTTLQMLGFLQAADGIHVLGALIDPFEQVPELIESNNALAGNAIGLGHDPDLIVTGIHGPPSVRPGDFFDISVAVCNQGQSIASDAEVAVHLSTDASSTSDDIHIGSGFARYLEPGACADAVIRTYASVPGGAYTLGAQVDPFERLPEIFETNNTSAGGLIGIGHEPDLVVTEIRSPGSALPGSQVAVTVTVCNQGQGPSWDTMVELRLSADQSITIGDFPAGSAGLGPLLPDTCEDVLVHGYTYMPEGLYFLGAVVDPYDFTPEIIESNNVRADERIAFGWGPDLVITSVSGPPSVLPGGRFDTTVTVCNQGTTHSQSTMVELALIRSGAHALPRDPFGGMFVDSLEPGACTTMTVGAYSLMGEGVFVLEAVVDARNYMPELSETNNVAAGGLISVGHAPDLAVTAVHGPATVPWGRELDVTVTVCNQGQSPSHGGHIALHLSADERIAHSDPFAGGVAMDALDPGACADLLVRAVSSAPQEGVYRLGAMVFPYAPELIDSNDAMAGDVVGIGYGPDLVIASIHSPASAQPGTSFAVTATVCNQGTSPSYDWGTHIELRLSVNGRITMADYLAGGGPVGYLEPGMCQDVLLNAMAPGQNGSYHLGVLVDPFDNVHELIDSNNTRVGALIGIGHEPDLVIESVSGPPSILPGASFDATITVCNQGQSASPDAFLMMYLSADDSITPADYLTHASVGYLEPGACEDVLVNAIAWGPDGLHRLGAVVDVHDSIVELIETNNASDHVLVGLGHEPDLTITSISGPASALPGTSFEVTVTVCNQGQSPSPWSNIRLMLSTDDRITATDYQAGDAPVGQIDPGACEDVLVSAWAPGQEGAYRLGGVVDTFGSVPEIIETNNTAVGERMGFGWHPDVVIASITAPDTVMPDQSFEVTFEVCNQGQSPLGFLEVELYVSMDAVITPHADVRAHSAFLENGLDVGACQSVTVPLYGHPAFGPGTYFLGAVADPYDYASELFENNNASASRIEFALF